jgi:hypothetical protein
MIKNLKEVIIDEEKIYLKKDRLGWHEVHLIKNEDGSINWKNLISGGSWIKLGIVIFIVLIILGCILEYSTALKIANNCLNNSCLTCLNQQVNYPDIITKSSGLENWAIS